MAVTAGRSSARPKFKFLMVSNEPKTARQRELEVTEIRTHAARISYRKKNTPPGGGTAARASHRSTRATGSFNSSTETSDVESDDSSSLIKLRTRLGGGRVDPFNSDSVPGLPTWILDLVDNAWTNAWCNLRSGRHDGLVHPDVYGWRQAGLSCPALVHAHISGAIGIALAQGAWADQSSHLHRTQIYHAILAINYVRKELGRCKASPPDELMLSIMTLSGHGEVVPDEDSAKPRGYTESPLTRANRVDIFAKLQITDAHAQAIGTLVEKKGGLDQITLPGFRNLLCLTDVLQASIKGSQPRLPYVGDNESLVSSGKHVLDYKALEFNATLGTGFEHAGIVAVSTDLYTALLGVCELTGALDHPQRHENNPPALVDMVEYRLYVQYRLISLAPVDAMGALHDDDYTYESCRIAALMYSDLKVWPLPHSTKTRPRLATQLRHTLERHESTTSEVVFPEDPLLWIAMMGAIASNKTKDQDYFLGLLAQDARAFTWKDFHSTMRHYIWCDFVVSPLALPLWYQACVLRSTMGILDSDGL